MEHFFSGEHNTETAKKINDEFRMKVLPVTIFVGAEIILGVIGNVVVLYVFIARYSKCTYRCFIIYLGLIDILSCFTSMAGEIVSHMFWFTYDFQVICQIKSFFNVFTVSADVLCLLTIAIDRYKQIRVPDAIQMSPLLAVYLCIGITVAAAAMAIPGGIVSGKNHFNYTYNDTTFVELTMCGVDDKYQNSNFDRIYVICLQSLIGISLAPMVLLYVIIARTLCTTDGTGDGDSDSYLSLIPKGENKSSKTRLRQQTVMMFTVTMLFVVTIVAYLILDSFILKDVKKYTFQETVTFLLFFRFYFMNHVINPVIYGWLDPEFRLCMRSMCRC